MSKKEKKISSASSLPEETLLRAPITEQSIEKLLDQIKDEQTRSRLRSVLVVLGIAAPAIPLVASTLDWRGIEAGYIGAELVSIYGLLQATGFRVTKKGIQWAEKNIDQGAFSAYIVILIAFLIQLDKDQGKAQYFHGLILILASFFNPTSLNKNINAVVSGATVGAYGGLTATMFLQEAMGTKFAEGTTGFYSMIFIISGLIGAYAVSDRQQKESNVERLLDVSRSDQLAKAREKSALQQAAAARERAEKALDLLQKTIHRDSHEFRGRIAVVSQALSLLRNSLDADSLELIEVALYQLEEATLEAMNMNDYASLRGTEVTPTLTEVPLEDLVTHIDSFKPGAQVQGLEYQVELKGIDPQAILRTDRRRVMSILSNLLSNALKYTQKGYVHVTLEKVPEGYRFTVKDSGQGISSEELPRIWDEEFRTRKALAGAVEGQGYGLSIVKYWAELLGGEVSVISEEKNGSTFSVLLKNGVSKN
jgi:signal transduction histidine kinase